MQHPTRNTLDQLAEQSRQQQIVDRQRPTRRGELDARRRAVGVCHHLRNAGYSCRQVAERIGMASRTLSNWKCRDARNQLHAEPRGRPPKQSCFADRYTVLEVLQDVGPQIGLSTLRALFPDLPRCELADLQHAYRDDHRKQNRISVEELTWTTPGRVWAMDHYDPPQDLDGYKSVFAVRDLASGMQLAWMPVPDETAERTAVVLTDLFRQHGAPLILKSDNGSGFISHDIQTLLRDWNVTPLRSPPRTPRYNGSCEAGIGSLQTTTFFLATTRGKAAGWSLDHFEAARRQANETHRPNGHAQPTAYQLWEQRTPITQAERFRCQETIERYRLQLLKESADQHPVTEHKQLLINRRAVRQALLELGLLSITRRSITLPIKSQHLAKII